MDVVLDREKQNDKSRCQLRIDSPPLRRIFDARTLIGFQDVMRAISVLGEDPDELDLF